MKRKYSTTVTLCLCLVLCACTPEQEPSTGNEQANSSSELRNTRAPAGFSFLNHRTYTVTLNPDELNLLGQHVIVKIYRAEHPDQVLFHGKVVNNNLSLPNLELPLDVPWLHYEIYTELGENIKGVIEL